VTINFKFLFLFTDLIPPGVCNLLNPSTIYANNEVNLEEVDVYGFDYDYTLALYSSALDEMIYNKAREFLVEHFKVRERHNFIDINLLFCMFHVIEQNKYKYLDLL